MKNKILSLWVLMLFLCGLVNAGEVADYTTSYQYQTDYLQDNLGFTDFRYGALCTLTVDYQSTYSGTTCPHALWLSNFQKYDVTTFDIVSYCNETNVLSRINNTNEAIVWTHARNLRTELNESRGNAAPFTTDHSQLFNVLCDTSGLTCVLTPVNAVPYECVHPDMDTGTEIEKELYLSIPGVTSTELIANYYYLERNLGLQLSEDLYYTGGNSTGTHRGCLPWASGIYGGGFPPPQNLTYFVMGEVDNLAGLTENEVEDIYALTKDVIINVTEEPAGANMAAAELGIWRCPDRNNYLPSNPDLGDYFKLKNNCCNILSGLACGNAGAHTDANGDYAKDNINPGTCLDPQAVFYLHDDVYGVIILAGSVDFGGYTEDLPPIILPWGGADVLTNCHEFLDEINSSTISGGIIRLSLDNDVFTDFSTDSELETCISASAQTAYTLQFMKAGYTSAFFDFAFIEQNMNYANFIYRLEDNKNYYNISGYVFGKSKCDGTTAILPQTTIGISCYNTEITQVNLLKLTDENGFYEYLNFGPENDYCTIYADKNDYDGGEFEYNMHENKFKNFTLNSLSCDEETNENYTKQEKVTFSVLHSILQNPLDNAAIKLTSPACGHEIGPYTTDNDGLSIFSNLISGCDYDYLVSKKGFKTQMGPVNGRAYIPLNLKPLLTNDGFVNVYVEYNGTATGDVNVLLSEGGTQADSRQTDVNGNINQMSCTSGRLYTVTANYEDAEKTEKFICKAEGSQVTIKLLIGSKSIELIKTFNNFVYDVLFPIFLMIFFFFSIGLLFKSFRNITN